MSSIEERLARDIAAVTGGVVVTDSDLREARSTVHELVETKRRRDRLRTVALGVAAAVVLGAVGATAFLTQRGDDEPAQLAGPGSGPELPSTRHLTGSAPTPALVAGVWRLDNGNILVKFDENGTVRFDDRGTLFSDPATIGTYAIDGDVITVRITDDEEQPGCIGKEFAMRAAFPDPGAMRFVRSGGECPALRLGRGTLERVLPASQSIAGLVFSGDTGWQPVSDQATLHGVWVAEGGGHVLEMAPDGAYYVVDDSGEPVDVGQWSLRDADLTLTSSASSATCGGGDQLALGAVEWVDPGLGTIAFRGSVEQNACGGAWTPATWILLPHQGR